MKKRVNFAALLPVVAVVAAGLTVSLPAWLTGLPAGSDTVFHASWYTNFSAQLWSGELYPRWLAGMNGGLGSPVFFYYAPLPYHLTSLLVAPLAPAGEYGLRHLALSTALSFVVSGLTCYLWLRQLAGPRAAATGAVLYLLAPYHSVVDLYMRGAFSELWAFAWMPLVLYFARRVATRRSRLDFAGLSLSYALLVLTHLPATLIFSPVPVCYALFASGRKVAPTLRALAALALGAGLAAVYLIPALTMQDYAAFADMHAYNYFERWVTFEKANVRDLHGQLFWGALTSALLVVCAALFRSANRAGAGEGSYPRVPGDARSDEWDDRDAEGEDDDGIGDNGARGADAGRGEMIFWAVTAALSILMTTFASDPVWRLVSVLQKVQFPWRFSLVLCLAVSAAVALGLGRHDRASARLSRRPLIFAALLAASWVYFWGGAALRGYPSLPRGNAVGDAARAWMDRGRDAPEYRPARAASNAEHDIETLLRAFCADDRSEPRACAPEGAGAVIVTRRGPRELDLQWESSRELTFRVTQFHFPGWAARLDGRPHPLDIARPDGLLLVSAPPGRHSLRLTLEPTAPERTGRIVSAASALLLLLLWPASALKSKLSAARGRTPTNKITPSA